MAFCFSFAAICFALHQIEAGAIPSVSDSFIAVRQRMGAPRNASLLSVFGCRGGFGIAVVGYFLGIAPAATSPRRSHHSARRSCVRGLDAIGLIPLWARDTGAYLGQL